MNLFRKLICALTVTTCLLLPQGSASEVRADHGHAQVRTYYLYYRASPTHSWGLYGYSSNTSVILYYVRLLRYHGYDAFVR